MSKISWFSTVHSLTKKLDLLKSKRAHSEQELLESLDCEYCIKSAPRTGTAFDQLFSTSSGASFSITGLSTKPLNLKIQSPIS